MYYGSVKTEFLPSLPGLSPGKLWCNMYCLAKVTLAFLEKDRQVKTCEFQIVIDNEKIVTSNKVKAEAIYLHKLDFGLFVAFDWTMEIEIINPNADSDCEMGYRDRKNGYYDKWYHYNRGDSGKAYDAGVKKCIEEGSAGDNLVFIEAFQPF